MQSRAAATVLKQLGNLSMAMEYAMYAMQTLFRCWTSRQQYYDVCSVAGVCFDVWCTIAATNLVWMSVLVANLDRSCIGK